MCLTHVSEKEMTRSCVVGQALGGGPPACPKVESALGTCTFSRAIDFEQNAVLSKFKCLGVNSIEVYL